MYIATNPLSVYNDFKKSNAKEDATSNPENTKRRRATTRKYNKFMAFQESPGTVRGEEEQKDSGGKSSGGEGSSSDGMVEGSLRSLIKIEPLAPRGCKVTYMLNVDLESNTSSSVAAKYGLYLLESLRSMKTFFERNSKEVDIEVAEVSTSEERLNSRQEMKQFP